MIKAILFDLDNCLSAADEPGQQLLAPAFDAITRACHGSHSPSALQNAFADIWRHAFDFVAERHGFTPAMKEAGWAVLQHVEVVVSTRCTCCYLGDWATPCMAAHDTIVSQDGAECEPVNAS